MSISTGKGFQAQNWPVTSGFAIEWIKDGKESVLVGDFDGDRKTDLAHTRVGWTGWQVHLSNGQNGFDTAAWSGAPAPTGWTDGSEYFVAGDLDGDGRTDIARHWLKHIEGEIGEAGFDFYRSTGKDFAWMGRNQSIERYTADEPADNCGCRNWCQFGLACTFTLPLTRVMTGDYNGDGKTDIALGDATKNYWLVYNYMGSMGSAKIPAQGVVGFGGDFTGSGRTDIAVGSSVVRDTGQPPDLLASVTNGRGGATEFTYASSSQFTNTLLPFAMPVVSVVKVKDGLGNESSMAYAYEGGYHDLAAREFRGFRSVKRTNPDGTSVQTWFHQKDDATVTWTQAEDGDFKGKVRHVEVKDAAGKVVSATDYTWSRAPAKGLSPAYPVVVQLGKVKVTDTVGGASAFKETSYGYDAYGNIASVAISGTDAESITTTYVPMDWGASPRSVWKPQKMTVTGSTSGKIREATFNYYAGTGNLAWTEPWLNGGVNPRTSYTYYPEGNLETITDPLQRVTRFDYEPTRTLPDLIVYPKTGTTPQVTHEVSASYDYIHGQVDNLWDENGNKTHVEFDDFGRPTALTVYVGDGPQIASKKKFEYFDSTVTGVPSSVKTSVLESVSGTTESYILVGYEYLDGLGRSIETVSPAATWASDGKTVISRTSYDAMGRPWFLRGPFFGTGVGYGQNPAAVHPWLQRDYDGTGRLGATRRSDGQAGEAVTTLSYSGSTVTVTDPDQKKASWKSDYLGRTIEVTEYGDGGAVYTTKYAHDAAGQLKRIDDHRLNYWTFDYDTLGRKKGMRDPDAGAWGYDYYADGNLMWQRDAKGVRVDFAYDDLSRIKTLTYSNGQPTVTYTYDTAPNGIGRLANVSVGQAVVESVNEYDALGRARSASKTIAGNASAFTSATDFDLAGRLSALTYPDNYKVGYVYYTGTGVLQAVRGSDATLYATFTGHDLSGEPGILSFGNGATTHHTRDPLSMKLTGIVIEIPGPGGAGKVDLLNLAIASSGAGDVAKLSDYKKGADLGLPGGVFEYAYDHDALHRMRRETLTQPLGTASQDIAYQRHPTLAHAFGSVTRAGSSYSFSYDTNGNTTTSWDLSDTLAVGSRQVSSSDYNADNLPTRLVYSRGGLTQTAEYLYDGAGMRARKSVGLDTTFYVGKHYEVVNGEPVKYMFAGGFRIAMRKGANTYYFHKDHLGSTVAVTGVSGTVVWKGNYLPFGALREESGTRVTNYLYTDQEYDPESGLYYFGARYYDPVLGRFLTPDSIVPRPFDPQSLNRYAYVGNSPASRVDPDGHTYLCISLGPGGISLSCPGGGGGGPPSYDPWSQPPGPYQGPYGGVPSGGGASLGSLLPPPPPTPQPNRPPPQVVTDATSLPSGQGSGVDTVAPPPDTLFATTVPIQSNFWLRAIVPGQVAWDNARTAWRDREYAWSVGYTAVMLGEQVLAALTFKIPVPTGGSGPTLRTTAHGAERVAGPAATRGGVLSEAGVTAAREGGRVMTQADGATVRILQNASGGFDVVIEGQRGLITTFQNLSRKSLERLARNYGWH